MNIFYENIDLSKPLAIRDRLSPFQLYRQNTETTFDEDGNKNTNRTYLKIEPTPIIQIINSQNILDAGGSINVDDVILRAVPAKKFTEEFLLNKGSASNRGVWILYSQAGETKLFTTSGVRRYNPLFFMVHLEPFKSQSDISEFLAWRARNDSE